MKLYYSFAVVNKYILWLKSTHVSDCSGAFERFIQLLFYRPIVFYSHCSVCYLSRFVLHLFMGILLSFLLILLCFFFFRSRILDWGEAKHLWCPFTLWYYFQGFNSPGGVVDPGDSPYSPSPHNDFWWSVWHIMLVVCFIWEYIIHSYSNIQYRLSCLWNITQR